MNDKNETFQFQINNLWDLGFPTESQERRQAENEANKQYYPIKSEATEEEVVLSETVSNAKPQKQPKAIDTCFNNDLKTKPKSNMTTDSRINSKEKPNTKKICWTDDETTAILASILYHGKHKTYVYGFYKSTVIIFGKYLRMEHRTKVKIAAKTKLILKSIEKYMEEYGNAAKELLRATKKRETTNILKTYE